VCDCVLALKLLDAEALLARCARVILADLRLPLDLCAETGTRRAQAVDLGEEIPVGSIFPFLRRVGSSFVLIGRQQEQASQFHGANLLWEGRL
jgi:hypothetical protein